MMSSHYIISFYLIFISFFNVGNSLADEKISWYKGNTHTHSLWSDGNDFPEMIARVGCVQFVKLQEKNHNDPAKY